MQTVEEKRTLSPAREISVILAGRRVGLCGFDESETQRIRRATSVTGSLVVTFDERMLADSARFCDAILIRFDTLSAEGLRAAAGSVTPILAIIPGEAIFRGAGAVYSWTHDFLCEPWSDAELLVRLFRLLDTPTRLRTGPRPPATEPTVLIADDDPDMIPLVNMTLRNDGINCLTADNGIAALRVARERNPDLLLLDVQMPGMNGFDVLETVRCDSGLQSMRVLLVTGSDDPSHVLRGSELHADGYLAKPVSPTVLLNRVKRLLSTNSAGAPCWSRSAPVCPGSEAKVAKRWINESSPVRMH